MKISFKKQSGFTLVEALLYTLILTVISTTMVLSLYEVIKVRLAVEREREVVENLRFATAGITKLFREGHDIATGTGSETHPAAIRIYLNETNTTFFDLDTNVKTVLIDGSAKTIRYLQYNLNAGTPVQLTSNSVNVSTFTLEQLTVGTEPSNIQMVIQLQHASGAGNSLSTRTSVSLRQ